MGRTKATSRNESRKSSPSKEKKSEWKVQEHILDGEGDMVQMHEVWNMYVKMLLPQTKEAAEQYLGSAISSK